MLKINRKLEYALMVLKFIKDRPQEDLCSAREICDQFKIPFDSTAKVMQIMNNHGVLTSCQGVKGGYKLQTDLSKLNYLQLAKIIEGKEIWTNCEQSQCGLIKSCNITGPIQKLNQYLSYFFQSLSIEELLQDDSLLPTGILNSHIEKSTKQFSK